MASAFLSSGKSLYVNQDPQAVKDYAFNWTSWLDAPGDFIVDATWTAATGLEIQEQSFTANTATVWLKGGTIGTAYKVNCHIVTDGGRQDDRSFTVKIVEQ